MIEILESKLVKIRKTCKCWGCEREFKPGYKMQKITSVDQGEFCHTAWCEVCQAVLDSFDPIDMDAGFSEGEIKGGDSDYWEEIRLEIEDVKSLIK